MVDQQQRSPQLASRARVESAKTNLALASMQNAEVMELLDGEDLGDCASTLEDEEEGLVGIDVREKAKWLSEVFEKREEPPKKPTSSATLLLPGKLVANRLKWLGETNNMKPNDDEPTEETDGPQEVTEHKIGSCQPAPERESCGEHTQKTTTQPSKKVNLKNQKSDPIEEQLAWLEDEERKMEDSNPAKKLISEHIAWLQSMKEERFKEEPDLEEEGWFGIDAGKELSIAEI